MSEGCVGDVSRRRRNRIYNNHSRVSVNCSDVFHALVAFKEQTHETPSITVKQQLWFLLLLFLLILVLESSSACC